MVLPLEDDVEDEGGFSRSSRGRMPSGKPNPVDVHVGARVRLRRTLLGMSQEKLGEALGLEADPGGPARVLAREFHGHHWQFHLEDRGSLLTLVMPLECRLDPGQACRLRLIRGGQGILFPGGQSVEVV